MMTSITTWNVAMMVETVVDVTYTQTTAQNANVLIPMKVGVEQIALKQQQQFQQQAGEEVHTLRLVNDATEGSTQEAPMCAS